MNKKEIFELIRANPGFHLATVEGDQPRGRGGHDSRRIAPVKRYEKARWAKIKAVQKK